MPRLPARAALAASVSTLVALPMAGIAQAAPTPPAKPVTVMTRNLYLGADINRPVAAALAAQDAGATGPQIVQVLAVATDATRAIVDATDFPTRSKLLAREIAGARPDLVGLQEVALWRSGPLELDKVGLPNAETSTTTSSRSCSATSPRPGRRTRRPSSASGRTSSHPASRAQAATPGTSGSRCTTSS